MSAQPLDELELLELETLGYTGAGHTGSELPELEEEEELEELLDEAPELDVELRSPEVMPPQAESVLTTRAQKPKRARMRSLAIIVISYKGCAAREAGKETEPSYFTASYLTTISGLIRRFT